MIDQKHLSLIHKPGSGSCSVGFFRKKKSNIESISDSKLLVNVSSWHSAGK